MDMKSFQPPDKSRISSYRGLFKGHEDSVAVEIKKGRELAPVLSRI